MLGDFNFPLNKSNDPNVIKFSKLLEEFSLHQHVTSPTCKSLNTLDLVMTRSSDEILLAKPKVKNFISDHAAIICHLRFCKPNLVPREFSYRKIKDIDLSTFKKDIIESDLVQNPAEDLEELVKQYNQTLSNILNKHAPLKTCKIRKRESQPWYNKNVQSSKQKMRIAERKWRKSKHVDEYMLFSAERKTYMQVLKKTKIEHFNSMIIENENDQKQLFKVAKSLCKSYKESPLPEHDSKEELAEKFGQHFIEKIDKIRDNFGPSEGFDNYDARDFTFPNLSKFTPVSVEEVKQIVLKSPSKSCMLDPIPTSLLKECTLELMPFIAKVVNLSIETGKMPNTFKHAVITPLLKKKGLKLIYKNFRRVSGLPFLSKVIEKVISKQLSEHVTASKLNEQNQSAYRNQHSTETALLKIMNDLLLIAENQQVALMAFLDLSAAFDTVDHNMLLSRL